MYSNKTISAEFNFPVGIKQYEEMPVVLSPNPATDFIYLKKTRNVSKFDISISDMNGKMVMVEKNLTSQNQLNIKGLKQGIYYVRIALENKFSDSKLVVLRN